MAPPPQPVQTFMLPQADLVADLLGVVVLLAADGVPAPAHDEVRLPGPQRAGIAQDVEHGVGDAIAGVEVELPAAGDLGVDEDHVAQHGEQQLADAADHLAVHEGLRRRVLQGQLDAAVLLDDEHVEIVVLLQHLARVVGLAADVEHRQRAAPQHLVLPALARAAQPIDLVLREQLEAALGHDFDQGFVGACVQGRMSIGVLRAVISQMSTMSALDTAMQPLVQSVRR